MSISLISTNIYDNVCNHANSSHFFKKYFLIFVGGADSHIEDVQENVEEMEQNDAASQNVEETDENDEASLDMEHNDLNGVFQN